MSVSDIAEPNDYESGFSLAEVLVALVILSVIASLMTGFMGQLGTLKRIQSENTAQLEVEALANFLGETISGAMPLHLIDQNPERRLLLEGGSDRLRFTALVSKGMAAHQLREVAIRLTNDADRQNLVQSLYPRRYGARPAQASDDTDLLASGITQLTFRYLEARATDGSPQWLDSWTERPGLPTAIEISLTTRRDDRDVSATRRAIMRFASAPYATP